MLSPVGLEFLDAGHCLHPEWVVMRNRRIRPIKFPSMFAVIEHPKAGVILFDTGYSMRFRELTTSFPGRLYQWVTPVTIDPQTCAVSKLERKGIEPRDVRHIIVSHFHADHICALTDFPAATYWFHRRAWDSVRHRSAWRGVYKGFLPDLIPDDFMARSRVIESRELIDLPSEFLPYRKGYDLLKDGSLMAVELPGHACGQLGLFLQSSKGQTFFLAADACWHSESYRSLIFPHPITSLLFDDYRVYQDTLMQIQMLWQQRKDIVIAPSHCSEFHAQFCNKGAC